MGLDPQAKLLLDATAAAPEVVLCDDTLMEQRIGFGGLLLLAGEAEPVFAVEDLDADGVPVRVYRPAPDPDLPVVVYFHGGGWTIGTVEQFDPILRQVANASNAIVVAPDYRLAPEHPFPAPLDDCWRALQWTAQHAADFGGDARRLAVMGDSAGGNLAAVCALLARDAGAPELALQVLVYPVTDCDFATTSYRDNAEGYLLTTEQMRWFFDCYTRGGVDPTDWRISPRRAPDHSGIAPALVITAEFDPLRDEGQAYAQQLRDAGVRVDEQRYDGMIHAFFGLSGAFAASRDALQRSGTELQRAFGTLRADMAVLDVAGFVADLKDHAVEHGFHVHDERHFVESYSLRQTWEVDVHPEEGCEGPLDLYLSLEIDPRVLLGFEDAVIELVDDDDPPDDFHFPLSFTWALPPLTSGPDLLVLATELAGVGGPDLPLEVSATDSFPSATDAPERSLRIVAHQRVSLLRIRRGDEVPCSTLDACLAVSRYLLDRAAGWLD